MREVNPRVSRPAVGSFAPFGSPSCFPRIIDLIHSEAIMSKSYLVRLPLELLLTPGQMARRGRLEMGFDVLNILPPERMAELLSEVLRNSGWKEANGKWVKRSAELGIWTIDPVGRTIEIDASGRLAQRISLNSVELSDQNIGQNTDPAAIKMSETTKVTIQSILQGLENSEKDLIVREAVRARQAVAETLKDVYRQALPEKAKGLGNIVSVNETSENGSMRIRIELT